MSSIRDIAKVTGLSIGTISRHINRSGYVSEKSAEKIQKAIIELDYVPNEHARAVFKNETNLIGVIVSSLSNPFFAEMTTHLERKAQSKGYGVIICTTDDDPERERQAFKLLRGYRVSGIISMRTRLRNIIKKINIPIISFETEMNEDVITVASDNYEGGKLALDYLYDKGCKKILHIKGPFDFRATESRCEGFSDEAKKKNIDIDIIQLDADFSLGSKLDDMLTNQDILGYDGIFVFNDIAAVLVMGHLQEKGKRIPEDIKVIGFDNSFIGELVYPKLTTIKQPIDEIASKSINLLVDIIEGNEVEKKQIVLPVELLERDST